MSSVMSSNVLSGNLQVLRDIKKNVNLEKVEKMKKLFETKLDHHHHLSASAYDTARVAMVPSTTSPNSPHFPGCVNWILENQQKDGGWGLHPDPSLLKDTMSSTLACVLALKRWGIGDQTVNNALGFIERNSASLTDSTQQTPIGFDIVFPAMIQAGSQDFNLDLPLNDSEIQRMLNNRDSLLRAGPTSEGHKAYLAYISEGIIGTTGDYNHWESAMKFQRKNGSLFNSPSATAAAFLALEDSNSLNYLRSVLVDHPNNNNNNVAAAVPSIYPHGILARLNLIDAIESLGIDCHFREEIKQALDEIYTFWQQGKEEIFLNPTICAMAFRILRLNRYPVSPDVFDRFTQDRFWSETMEGYLKDEGAVLELYKASNVILPEEEILEQQQSWTKQFLLDLHHHRHQEVDDDDSIFNHRPRPNNSMLTQVHNALKHPFRSNLEPLAYKRNIEQYSINSTRLLKSSYSSPNFGGQDFLDLAMDTFASQQSVYREELDTLMSWLKDHKMDELRLAKVKMGYCYFHALATFLDPQLLEARSIFCKHSILVSLIDDLFDMFGTPEELLNMVHLIERWDPSGPTVEFASKRVEVLYMALHSTINETVEKAYPSQDRSVMNHVVQLWVELLQGMLQETEWSATNTIPTLKEYMRNASITFALGPFFVPSLYFSGDKLSEQVLNSAQYDKLFNITATCGRLLNDRTGFEREAADGKENAVSLYMSQGRDVEISVGEALEDIESSIDDMTRQVLRISLDEKGNNIPTSVRDMFWKTLKSLHLFYQKEDLYNSSTKLVKVVHSLINDPITNSSTHST